MKQKDGLDLKVTRIKLGVKAIDVAMSLGWSPSKLSLIENSRTRMTPDLLVKIRKVISTLSQEKKFKEIK